MLGGVAGASLHGIRFVICKILVIVSVMIAGYVIVHVRGHAGAIYDLAVFNPFLFIGPVGNGAAVGGIGQVAGIDDKKRVDNVSGFRDSPGEIFCILAAVSPDVSIRYDHKPEQSTGAAVIVSLPAQGQARGRKK